MKNEIPAQNYPRPPIKLTLTEWYVQSEKKQKFNFVTPSHISKTEREKQTYYEKGREFHENGREFHENDFCAETNLVTGLGKDLTLR